MEKKLDLTYEEKEYMPGVAVFKTWLFYLQPALLLAAVCVAAVVGHNILAILIGFPTVLLLSYLFVYFLYYSWAKHWPRHRIIFDNTGVNIEGGDKFTWNRVQKICFRDYRYPFSNVRKNKLVIFVNNCYKVGIPIDIPEFDEVMSYVRTYARDKIIE